MMFEEGSWNKKKLDKAVECTSYNDLFNALCEWIGEECVADFLAQYCDDNDCWPDDE